MDKALEIYAYVLKEHLSNCFINKQNINPIDLNKERFKTKAVFIAALMFLKNNSKQEEVKIVYATNKWLINSFADGNLFSSIIENISEGLTKLIDDNLCDLIGAELIDIPTFYETMLSIESGDESNGTKISTAKNYRNRLGSYYTPANLAKSVTEKTIDTFFELNFGIKKISANDFGNLDKKLVMEITSISFADFSCGAGNFLIAVMSYFEELFERLRIKAETKADLLESVALNITAFDVDCLALEIAKLNLLLRIKKPVLYRSLSTNFIHGNFLLESGHTVDELRKVEIFSSGFIYHEQLGLSKSKLKKYDVVLGNPPWEKIRFEEKKFYALYSKTIANNHFKSSRTNEINETELKNAQLAEFSKQFKLEIDKAKLYLKKSRFFSMSNNGELNTYVLFADAAVKLKSKRGVVGLVLKSAIITSQVNQKLFKYLTKESLIVAIFDFINRKKIFNIDSRERFCFLLLGNSQNKKFQVSMNLREVDEIEMAKSKIELSYDCLKSLNPITGMLPNFTTKYDADFLLRLSFNFPFFKDVYSDVRFGRIVHFTNHAEFITKKKAEDNIAIYEGKFFNQFDGKFTGFNEVGDKLRYGNKSSSVLLDESKKRIANYLPESRFFINQKKWLQLSKNYNEEYMLAWRSLTSATNTRSCIATVLPFIPASQSVQFLAINQNDLLYLAGLFNSVVFDYVVKKKISGIDLTQSVIKQIPVPKIEHVTMNICFNGYSTNIKEHINMLVFSLLRNDARLNQLFMELKLNSKTVIEESKFETKRKIDLLFMLLYRLSKNELELVLNSFSKQYSKNDITWFKEKLGELILDNPVSPASSFISSSCPI